MKFVLAFIALVYSTSLFAAPPEGPLKSSYGDPEAKSESVMPLEKAMAEHEKWMDKSIAVTGTVKKVCKKMGCWVTLESGGKSAKAVFRDHGFAVPKEIIGKKIQAIGVLAEKKQSAAEARHYAKDDGASMKELSAIKGSKMVFQFTADKIKVL